MAIDQILALKSAVDFEMPVFRVYRWKPYAISLGHHQNPKQLNLEKCARDGIDVVSRPTGGRAVLHAEEVTYSVIIPKNTEWYAADILSTYNRISRGLLHGLRLFGVNAQLVQRSTADLKSSDYKHHIPCFSSSGQYEVAVNHKKLVGSAQRHFEKSILQHGSILIGDYHLKLADYILLKSEADREEFHRQLREKTVSISQLIQTGVVWEELVDALKLGFQNEFQIDLIESQLTPQELTEVNQLITTITKIGGEKHAS